MDKRLHLIACSRGKHEWKSFGGSIGYEDYSESQRKCIHCKEIQKLYDYKAQRSYQTIHKGNYE